MIMRRTGSYIRVASLTSALSIIATTGWSQSLTWLGGTYPVEAYAVSADGSVVVGSYPSHAGIRAFRWTAATGMQDLGTLGGSESEAKGVVGTAQSNTIVGWALNNSGNRRTFIMDPIMRDHGTLGGNYGCSHAISGDGRWIVGEATDASGRVRAFRHDRGPGLKIDLGTLGGNQSMAYAVNSDGSVVVGTAQNSQGQYYPFRWSGSMQNLGTFGGTYGIAYGVSADGSVVVGFAHNASGTPRAFRWTSSTGMQDLGTLPGHVTAVAYGASSNGSVVVGESSSSGSPRAFYWTQSGGMQDLNTRYARLLNGSVLWTARAITPDGRFIVGRGVNAGTGRVEAFLLDTRCISHNGDVDNNRCVDDADLLAILFAFGSTGSDLGRVDVNCDETVDDADLLVVLFNFGSGCGF